MLTVAFSTINISLSSIMLCDMKVSMILSQKNLKNKFKLIITYFCALNL
jgi:hypothetical protein